MVTNGDGFSYDLAGLNSVVKQFHDGAAHLDVANNGAVEMVDAGASSQIVGSALAALLMSSIDTAQALDNAAAAVNTAKGSYDVIEKTNKGAMDKKFYDGMKDYSDMMADYNGPPA